MKTIRCSLVLMMLQCWMIGDLVAKECTVAGLAKDALSEVVLKNFYGSHTTKTDAAGRFRFRVTVDSPQYFQLQTDKTTHVFLVPGDSIFINLGEKANVSPANESALISNYLLEWYALTDSVAAHFDRVAFYSQDPPAFQAAVTSLHAVLRAPLDRLLAHSPRINKHFVRIEKERINFWVWCPFNRYENRYREYTGKTARLPENFYEYLHKANVNDPSFLQMSDFDDFTNTFLEMKVFKASQRNPQAYEDPYFTAKVLLNAIGETFTNQKILDKILYHQMWAQVYYMDVNDSLFAIVVKKFRDPKYVKGLQKLYTSLQKFQAGRPAPDFKVMDAGESVHTLKDFRGKYLLIDVWGIYCSPCIRELPTLKEVKAEFHDADITFIAINLDGTKDAWVKRMKELNLDGLQFIAIRGWDSEFQKAYEIDQVPTFILLDREGKFVDARTKLPSEGLRYVLNTLPAIRNN